MKLKIRLERIRDYFARVSPNQLYNDLLECGLNDIDSWADAGVELADDVKVNAYTTTTTEFEFTTDMSYTTYRSELAEAA